MQPDDLRWNELEGGYRLPFDPRPVIDRLLTGETAAWDELWENLYHQGDVGLASYAAVPLLVSHASCWLNDWNFFALIATIEEARNSPSNPPLPQWLEGDYRIAWSRLEKIALQVFPDAKSDELVSSIFAVLAHCRRLVILARMAMLTEAERAELIDAVGWA